MTKGPEFFLPIPEHCEQCGSKMKLTGRVIKEINYRKGNSKKLRPNLKVWFCELCNYSKAVESNKIYNPDDER
jgi:hypothetical protein